MVASGSLAVSEVSVSVSILLKMTFISVYVKIIYGRELIAGEPPVSEKYMETCFSSNVAGGSPAL